MKRIWNRIPDLEEADICMSLPPPGVLSTYGNITEHGLQDADW